MRRMAFGWILLAACFAQADPVAASRRFRDAYHHIRFPEGGGIDDVTRISRTLLDTVFPQADNERQILDNPIIRLNFIVNRARPRSPESRMPS